MTYKDKMMRLGVRFIKEKLPNYHTVVKETDILRIIEIHLTALGACFYEDIVMPRFKDKTICTNATFKIEDYFMFLSQHDWYLDLISRSFEIFLNEIGACPCFIEMVNRNRLNSVRYDFFKNINTDEGVKNIEEYVKCVSHYSPHYFVSNAITGYDLLQSNSLVKWIDVKNQWSLCFNKIINKEIHYVDN